MATITGIYCIKNATNGKCYVGQSVNIKRRWAAHKRLKGLGRSAIVFAIEKYGIESFKFITLEECSRCELNSREVHWIREMNTLTPNGYNLNSGGDAPTFVSELTKGRQSKAQQGKVHPREVVEKRRQAVLGQKRSEETRHRLSVAMKACGHKPPAFAIEKARVVNTGRPSRKKGIPLSEETKAKLSASKTGVLLPRKSIKLLRSDGVIFDSVKQAANAIMAHRATIHKHLSGRLKTVHGYTFSRGGASSQI
jgi:group I intron endonuclease